MFCERVASAWRSVGNADFCSEELAELVRSGSGLLGTGTASLLFASRLTGCRVRAYATLAAAQALVPEFPLV